MVREVIEYIKSNMSDTTSLGTRTPMERVIGAPLHPNSPPGRIQNLIQNQNQNPTGVGQILSPSSIPARGHHQHNLNLPVQSGGYSMYVPSGPNSSLTRQPYGSTPTSSYIPHGTIPPSRPTSNNNTNSNNRYASGHAFVSDRNTPLSRFLSSQGSGSLSYTGNAQDAVGTLSSPWSQAAFQNASSHNPLASSPAVQDIQLPLSPPPPRGDMNGVSTRRALPMASRSPNNSSCFRQNDTQGSEYGMQTRSRAASTSSDVSASLANSIAAGSNNQTNRPTARRNILSGNPRGPSSQNTSNGAVGESVNASTTDTNDSNNSESPDPLPSPPPPPPPTTAVATRRRTRRTRANAASNAASNRTPSTTSNRKSPAKPRASKAKKQQQEPKKIQPPLEPDENFPCSICLDIPLKTDMASINGCSHTFCFQCIEKWADRENTCPLCKLRFTKIDRINKPPPKKRKKGDAPRAKNTKKVKNRDQRADIGIGNPLQGLFASMDGVVPQAITQLIFGPVHNRLMTITTGNTPSTRGNNNQRITIQNRIFSQPTRLGSSRSSRSGNPDAFPLEALSWVTAGASGVAPTRRSSRLDNNGNGARHRSESSLRSGTGSTGRSHVHGNPDHMFPFNPVRSFILDHPDFRNSHLGNDINFDAASDDEDSDPEYGALVSHLNRVSAERFHFDMQNRNTNSVAGLGNPVNHLDPDFFVRHSQFLNQNNDVQPLQAARSYALNLDGGDTADTALEIQDSDDEVEIADGSDAEVEVLVE